MSRIAKLWMGAMLIAPGVFTYTDVSRMTPPRGAPSRAVAVIATGRGGGVGSVTPLTSATQVPAALVSGPLAHLTRIVLDAGVSDVYAVRVNHATPAAITLGDVALTANNPGLGGRALQVRRVTSARRADAQDWYLRNVTTNQSEQYLGLGPVLDVTFRGAGDNPRTTVTVAGGVVTVALSSDTPAEGVSITSDSAATATQLADAINNSGAWSARIVGDAATLTTDLQAVNTVMNGTPAVATIAAGPNAIIRALSGSALARAAVPDAPAAAVLAPDYRFFSGGSEGAAPVLNDWIAALALCEELDVTDIVVGSGDLAVLAAARSHVQAMSTTKARRERKLWCGPDLSSSKAQLKADASAIVQAVGGERVIVAGNTVKDYDLTTGRLTTFPAYYLAAYAAGTKAANRPEESLTNVKVTLPGLGYVLNLDDLEEMLEAGVMPAHFDAEQNAHVITQGITSYTRDGNVILRKASGMDIMDYLNKKIRIRLKKYIGKVGDQGTVRGIKKEVESALREEVRGPRNPVGVLTAGVDEDGKAMAAFRNLEAEFDGFDFTGVRFEANPAGTNEYIGIQTTFTPTRIVA